MTETVRELERQIEKAVEPGFGGRLLDRGLARSLIWQNGVIPEGSPHFGDTLSGDLLDYGHTVLYLALRLRKLEPTSNTLSRAFQVAGEAIEAVVHRGDQDQPDREFHCVCAAVSYHLGGYAASAHSILPTSTNHLSLTETVLALLLRSKFDKMYKIASTWLLDGGHCDSKVANQLMADHEFTEDEAVQLLLTKSFMQGIACFHHAIITGNEESADLSRQKMENVSNSAAELHFIGQWWTSTLAFHLLDDIWQCSLQKQLTTLPVTLDDGERWNRLRWQYIQRLRMDKHPVVELWPSQLEAVTRCMDLSDDLVVALPTGAGKTRIAELCILRTLANGRRIVYITPLRALSAQIERDLRSVFHPLGYTVSSLYGAAGIVDSDTQTILEKNITVATPERLDIILRGNPSIVDDVGLVILDEGHMIDSSERGVRFEMLIQQLLLRDDSCERRIVCLSALFPKQEEMKEFVDWIRQDVAGNPVRKIWQPTRLRYGYIVWKNQHARLQIEVGEEQPFVPRFVEQTSTLGESNRKSVFPKDKNELTLASAWKLVEQGMNVLIYCVTRKSVNTIGKVAVEGIEKGVLKGFDSGIDVQNAIATGNEWLGSDHVAVKCLNYGIAMHHGRLPRPFLSKVEMLLQNSSWPITIASPTVTQGLNLPISALIIPNIVRNTKVMEQKDFRNVAGRAGRAFVNTEGLVLHIVKGKNDLDDNRLVGKWRRLVGDNSGLQVISGLLQLSMYMINEVARRFGVGVEQLSEHLLSMDSAWNDMVENMYIKDSSKQDWSDMLTTLDSTLFCLLRSDESIDGLYENLDRAFMGSLYKRQLNEKEDLAKSIVPMFLKSRAKVIWDSTSQEQREGCKVASIGLAAGMHFDENIEGLVSLLNRIEEAVLSDNPKMATEAILSFANIVFLVPPFRLTQEQRVGWKGALRAWMDGQKIGNVMSHSESESSVDLIQDVLMYRLPWAMEAVRSYAKKVGQDGADALTGLPTLAVAAGSTNQSVMQLLKAGLGSRDAAITVVKATDATFKDQSSMQEWLNSTEHRSMFLQENWPTSESRDEWQRFVESQCAAQKQKWRYRVESYEVEWNTNKPSNDTVVTAVHDNLKNVSLVVTPEIAQLGEFSIPLCQRSDIVKVWLDEEKNRVCVEYFGEDNS